jgi:UDP-glucose 4-epimerase
VKVAVSGATGFIGGALLSRLDQVPGTSTVPLVRRRSDQTKTVAIGDLDDPVHRVNLPSVDTVVHLAAATHSKGAQQGAARLASYRAVNVCGTEKLLVAAYHAGARHFVFVSSIKVNGECTTPGKLFTATDDPMPADAYGQSKLEAELLVRTFCETSGMDWTIIRPPLVYGAAAPANFAKLRLMAESRIPLPFGRFDAPRSFIFVENLVDFIAAIIDDSRARNQTFVISDGEDISVSGMLRIIAELQGRSLAMFDMPDWIVSSLRWLPIVGPSMTKLAAPLQIDTSVARAALDWTPPYSLREALRRTLGDQAR